MSYLRGVGVCAAGLLGLSVYASAAGVVIDQNALPAAATGISYSFQLTASGGTPAYIFSPSGPLVPGLTLSSSGLISGTPPAGSAGNYPFSIQVADKENIQGGSQFVLTINQGAPPLLVSLAAPPNGTEGAGYTFIFMATGGVPPYTWRANGLPPGLSMNPNGSLSGTPFANSAGLYNITVFVTDSQQTASQASFPLRINPAIPIPPLGIITPSLPNGTVGLAYSLPIQATGGTPPYRFSSAPGVLPPGVSMGSNGILGGVPAVAGTYPIVLVVQDGTGAQANTPFTFVITPPLAIATRILSSGSAGSNYSQTITATGGTPPYNFSIVTITAPGLTLSPTGILSGTPTTPGVFMVLVEVTDSLRVLAVQQFSLTIGPAHPAISVSTQSLSFVAAFGGDSPLAQTFTIVSSSGATVGYSIQIDNPAPQWLTLRPVNGSTPARVVVNVNPGTMPRGSYSTKLHVSVPSDSSQSPIDIPVNFALLSADPAPLRVTPNALRFAGRRQVAGTLSQVLVLQNSGGNDPVSFSASIVGNSPWIAGVTPASGQITPNSPVFLQIQVNTQGLAVGNNLDVIRINSPTGSADVPISLFIADSGTILGVSQTGIRFQGVTGAGASMPQVIQVFNIGDPALTINWKADLLSGADWLGFSGNPGGTATATQPGSLSLTPQDSTNLLPAGGRYALVRVSDPSALNSPQYVVAVLDLALPSTSPLPDPAPQGLVFTTSPAPQAVRIYTGSIAPVPFQAGVSTYDGGSWLSVVPASGTASTLNPGFITASVDPTGLSPGIYSADLNISMSGVLRTVSVTFIVVPPGSTKASAIRAAAGCSPSRLALTQTGLVNNFAVPAGWPATLIVQLNDDCGGSVLNGSVVANFSNGDPPLTLAGDNLTGTYSATWQPRSAAAQMTVTAFATEGVLAPASAQLVGAVNQNSAPVLFPQGTVNNSNPVKGAALAPGTVAQVYGTGLASQTASPGAVPLVTDFNGTNMLIGGLEAPLYYLSGGQLDVQIPYELAPARQYQTIVSANGAYTLPDTVTIMPVSPGVTAFPDGTLIAQHAANLAVLVDAINPAKPGESLTIYLAGMGATTPSVPSGQTAPATEPLARLVVPATITVDGQPAPISFAGLTPGGIGLYQINFAVPLNARAGNLPVVVTQGAVVSNTTTLLVGP